MPLREKGNNPDGANRSDNANIVVNRDTDKIIALKSPGPSSNPNNNAPRVQLDCDGAIETPTVSSTITSIIEGGPRGFRPAQPQVSIRCVTVGLSMGGSTVYSIYAIDIVRIT